jgi:hypothetical protein
LCRYDFKVFTVLKPGRDLRTCNIQTYVLVCYAVLSWAETELFGATGFEEFHKHGHTDKERSEELLYCFHLFCSTRIIAFPRSLTSKITTLL